jgi:hypothetical protein
MASESPEHKSGVKAHVITLLIVGGVLLFAFVLYLVAALLYWLVFHLDVLVYAFTALAVTQGYWMLFAYLKRRLGTRRAPIS